MTRKAITLSLVCLVLALAVSVIPYCLKKHQKVIDTEACYVEVARVDPSWEDIQDVFDGCMEARGW